MSHWVMLKNNLENGENLIKKWRSVKRTTHVAKPNLVIEAPAMDGLYNFSKAFSSKKFKILT